MKTVNKLQFGVNVLQNGQKNNTVNAAPQLVANSTQGKFMITAPVSKALLIAVGDSVMFINNIANVESAIMNNDKAILDYAAENNIDLSTREGQDVVLKAFSQWFIAKGIQEFNSNGTPVMVKERYTKEDKAKYLEANRMTIVEENRETLVSEFGELSDEELAEKITIDMIEAPMVNSYKGAKTSTSGKTTGIGAQLNFTDTAIWNSLKSDLEDPTSKNRIFDVDVTTAYKTTIFNGKDYIEIPMFAIDLVEDVNPIVREKKA